jgi:hypothetical protein
MRRRKIETGRNGEAVREDPLVEKNKAEKEFEVLAKKNKAACYI